MDKSTKARLIQHAFHLALYCAGVPILGESVLTDEDMAQGSVLRACELARDAGLPLESGSSLSGFYVAHLISHNARAVGIDANSGQVMTNAEIAAEGERIRMKFLQLSAEQQWYSDLMRANSQARMG